MNSKALTEAGVAGLTPNPYGGIIARNKSGGPTGILIDNAMNLVSHLIPPVNASELEEMIAKAVEELAAKGITTAYDMDVDLYTVDIYKAMAEADRLPIKINIFLKTQRDEWLERIPYPFAKGNMIVCGLKYYADGALGSRGAALLDTYEDAPENKGLLLINEDDLYAKAIKGMENGWQIATHAIGDAANRLVLNAYERLRKAKIATNKDILRIEHAQIIHPDDVYRFAENNIIASVQPVHCTSDAAMAAKRLNARALNNSYRWKSMLEAGITIMGGSDFPIESHDPVIGIDAFVNRIAKGSYRAWNAYERISAREAMKCYQPEIDTKARSNNDDFLQNGDKADVVVLNRDICNIEDADIKDVRVIAAYCGGKQIYGGKAD